MIISTATLTALRTAFNAKFKGGLTQATSQFAMVATVVPSTTKSNTYGWLGKVPNMRKWIGERVIQSLSEHSYTIENDDYELTIGVDRNDIKDDNIGVYDPLFTEMGSATAAHPDQMVFGAYKAGWDEECYDGQPFFDTDHPVIGKDGKTTTVANTDGGTGEPWFLLCTQRAIKPVIYQEREKPMFVAMDSPTDESVFKNKQFLYGVDGRNAVGYAFWQMAWGSKHALDATRYAAARAALTGMKGDHGNPLGLVPNLLVVGPSQESAARKLLNSENAAGGETNEWKGTAELLVVPWLA